MLERLIRFAIACYPASWRGRYGVVGFGLGGAVLCGGLSFLLAPDIALDEGAYRGDLHTAQSFPHRGLGPGCRAAARRLSSHRGSTPRPCSLMTHEPPAPVLDLLPQSSQ